MKRTLPWAIFAFYPLVALAAATSLGGRVDAYYAGQTAVSSVGALVANYWWPFVAVSEILVVAFFVVSVLRNHVSPAWHRILWATAMVFLGPLVIPLYWWRHTEPGTP